MIAMRGDRVRVACDRVHRIAGCGGDGTLAQPHPQSEPPREGASVRVRHMRRATGMGVIADGRGSRSNSWPDLTRSAPP